MDSIPSPRQENTATGPEFWMMRVAQECDRARQDFAPESVHDLRVALRRCRSIADVFMAFDPHPAWRQMKDEAKRLFGQLGALRDTQVMMEWAQNLMPRDTASVSLGIYLSDREEQLKEAASETLLAFDQKKWSVWTRRLSKRARHVSPDDLAFQHLALERLTDAGTLHAQARRNRSHAAYHRLRIGLKKFRYVVENFLPSRHETWGGGLRLLQDLLGEMHDLHVLWQTALHIRAFRTDEMRSKWRQRIAEEIERRLERYRQEMLGKQSLWQTWKAGLPGPDQMGAAALARLRLWANRRDPDFAHSEHAAKLALQIYDGLDSLSLLENMRLPNARFVLEAAALVHDVGKYISQAKHHIESFRMIRKLDPSPGLESESVEIIAVVARFHRGALPQAGHKALSLLDKRLTESIILLCGILRLANAFSRAPQRRIHKLVVRRTAEIVQLDAQGYSETDASAETLAAARHLLETACHMPIIIRQSGAPTALLSGAGV